MAEAEMSTQTMTEQSPDSTNPHPAHRGESQKRTEKVMTFHLYDPDVSASLLKGLTLSPCQLNTEIDGVFDMADDDQQKKNDTQETDNYTVSTKMGCSLCNCLFTSRQLQTVHYKLDWHRFNLKQKIMEAEPVTEDNFEKISGDVSSISGSDSSTDSDCDEERELSPYSNVNMSSSQSRRASNQSDRTNSNNVRGRRHPKVFFRSGDGKLVSVHRCVLYGKKNAPATQQELVAMAMQAPAKMKWLILMIGGGHFAGAIFDGKEIVSHKTFHRYTVRAKRGTAQGMRDSQQGGNQPKSAGASLRRYNEAALVEDIHTLFASWADSIESCHRIFLRAPSYNKRAFFGGKNPPLDHKDERIVTIPFTTRRPTYKEIKRVHELLTYVAYHGDANEAEKRIMARYMYSPKTSQPKDSPKVNASEGEQLTTANGAANPSSLREDKENPPENVVDSEDDLDLVLVEEEISTLDLQEFETSVKKPKRTKKKKKPKRKQETSNGKPKGIMEELCEACRQGNWDHLQAVLMTLEADKTIPGGAKEQSEETLVDADVREEKSIAGDAGFETTSLPVVSQDKTASMAGPESSVGLSEDDVVRNPTQDDILKNKSLPENESTTEECMMGKEEGMMGKNQGMVGNNQGMMGKDRCMMGKDQGMMDPKDSAAIVNFPVDEAGGTLLHVAVIAEQATIVWNLMDIGADPAIKNKKGQPPYVLCSNKEIRKEFRRYMAAHPEKYDYEKSQIPSPLTSDLEELKAAKAAEKRRLQKKNKRIREKEQKEELKQREEEQRKRDAEEEERRRFASLSDREKRALAAERRLNAQFASRSPTGTTTLTNIQRCWLCGNSLAGKVPFEYLDYKFCSIDCVKKHKQQQKNSKS